MYPQELDYCINYIEKNKNSIASYIDDYFLVNKPTFILELYKTLKPFLVKAADSPCISDDTPLILLIDKSNYGFGDTISCWAESVSKKYFEGAVKENLEDYFLEEFSEGVFNILLEKCDFFSDIKSLSVADRFIDTGWLINDFLGIAFLTLEEILEGLQNAESSISSSDRMIADYIEENTDTLITVVNNYFEKKKPDIQRKAIRDVRRYLNPIPYHYEWKQNNDPCNWICAPVKKDPVPFNTTVEDFLREYSGHKYPTYTDRQEWRYSSYYDELFEEYLTLGGRLMSTGIRMFLQNEFGIPISDNRFFEIRMLLENDLDEIYDNSTASDFCGFPDQIVGINNWSLLQILNAPKE